MGTETIAIDLTKFHNGIAQMQKTSCNQRFRDSQTFIKLSAKLLGDRQIRMVITLGNCYPFCQIMRLILYSKPGCHLCEGLQEKLEHSSLPFELEIRDITTRDEWFQQYQYEIPVLFVQHGAAESSLIPIPRPSPRISLAQLEQMLQKYTSNPAQ